MPTTVSAESRIGYLVGSIFLIPFICLPGYENILLTISARSIAIVSIAVICISIPQFRRSLLGNIISLPRYVNIALIACLAMAVLSSLLSTDAAAVTLLGSEPHYFGLVQLLAIAIICLTVFPSFMGEVLHKDTVKLLLILYVATSIAINIPLLIEGERLTGLAMHSSHVVYFASISLVLSLYALSKKQHYINWLGVIISLAALGLAQARIAAVVGLLIVGSFIARGLIKDRAAIVVAFIALLSMAYPFVMPISRFTTEDVGRGVQYRSHIYALTAGEILTPSRIFIGLGPASAPHTINQPKRVPKDIAQDLDAGLRFASSHNLYLDAGVKFGLIFAVIFVFFQFYWMRLIAVDKRVLSQDVFVAVLIVVCGIFNAMVDTYAMETMVIILASTGGLNYYLRQEAEQLSALDSQQPLPGTGLKC